MLKSLMKLIFKKKLSLIFCGEKKEDGEHIDIIKFGKVLDWFGAIKDENGDVISRILDCIKHDYFQGDLHRNKAHNILTERYKIKKKKLFSCKVNNS